MRVTDILNSWKSILEGRPPALSIEITKECPLACPGCYAYGGEHLGGNGLLNQVSDYRGDELIRRFMDLVERHQPLHISIVGGEPLVRFRELNEILPRLDARGIKTHVVTSAVRPVPIEWKKYLNVAVIVSIDGLAPEHDVRRKPATYERILKNIEGHHITIHCTITRQMTERTGYLREFLDFWSVRPEIARIWFSIFTPQIGETSYEILPQPARVSVVRELLEFRQLYPKLDMTAVTINGLLSPPASPNDCIFARTTQTITADLKTGITPCQFGGNPDCSQCGCIASAGLNAIGRATLPGGMTVGWLYEQSLQVGNKVAAMREY
ncbi:MAG TPA: radical SAM protein [Terriglobia bacterium]|jgi:MoaA/NifB/PqqE/SkfB family radical SAM enzyme